MRHGSLKCWHNGETRIIVVSDCVTALSMPSLGTPDFMLVGERWLTNDGIDRTQRLLAMQDFQDMPLLLFSAKFPRRSWEEENEKVYL